jgi:integrase
MTGAFLADAMAQLYDGSGRRKYLSGDERRRFIAQAQDAEAATRLFCLTLAHTGCRVSEALSLTPAQLDLATGCVILRTLKRRRQTLRAVPVPMPLLKDLIRLSAGRRPDAPLWSWCRQTAWRRIKKVMHLARIRGPQATAKGLRHGFGIANAENNIPIGTTRRWMGHARIETTTIYQRAVGREERAFAARLWT